MSEPEEPSGHTAGLPLPRLVFLVGPTAVGKTAVGVCLAPQLGAEILSIDARQIYKRLEIGTAKPSSTERCQVPHHLLDLYEPTEQVSAADFARHFQEARREIDSRGHRALAVGGAGLYVDACLGRLDPMPPASRAIRARHRRLQAEGGKAALHRRLAAVDPISAARLAPEDFQRVSRALEVCERTGVPLSLQQRQPGPFDLSAGPPMILLLRERAELNARIEARAQVMVRAGLLDEVRDLLEQGIPADCPAFESIGYAEFARVLRGETTLAEAGKGFIRRTRHYAKRQVTWFRNRYRGVRPLFIPPGEGPEQTAGRALRLLLGPAAGPAMPGRP